MKSVLPPTFSWWVRSSLTPRSRKRRVELAVDDRRADLRLDVVADDRQALLLEAPLPVRLTGDEDRDAVHERAAGREHLLDVPLRRLLRAHREVADDDVGAGLLEDADDVGRLARRLLDDLAQVLADAVVGHAAMHGHVELRDLGELHGVVLAAEDRLAQVAADLVGVDVECGRELDVRDVVAAEVDVHEAGHELAGLGVVVVVDALDEGRGAVAGADDGDAHLPAWLLVSVGRGLIGHAYPSERSCRLTYTMRWMTVIAGEPART